MQVYPGIVLMGGVGYDSNVYVIDGEIIVDTGTGIFFNSMKKEIESNYETRKIKTIINTHCHFDHTGADKKFRDWLKADIAIHEADKEALETGRTLADMFSQKAKSITTDNELKDKSIIKTENFKFEVIHTPGHTPGSICLLDKGKKILISGDTLFADGIGRTDFKGGSSADIQLSLKKLLKNQLEYLFPGHGNPKIGGVNFLIKQYVSNGVSNGSL